MFRLLLHRVWWEVNLIMVLSSLLFVFRVVEVCLCWVAKGRELRAEEAREDNAVVTVVAPCEIWFKKITKFFLFCAKSTHSSPRSWWAPWAAAARGTSSERREGRRWGGAWGRRRQRAWIWGTIVMLPIFASETNKSHLKLSAAGAASKEDREKKTRSDNSGFWQSIFRPRPTSKQQNSLLCLLVFRPAD